MKYYNTPLEEQETIIDFLYDSQVVRVYSNRPEIINILTKKIGKPTEQIIKSRTYWSAASWDINFLDIGILNKLLLKDNLIEPDFKYKKLKIKKKLKENYQVSFDNLIETEVKPKTKRKEKVNTKIKIDNKQKKNEKTKVDNKPKKGEKVIAAKTKKEIDKKSVEKDKLVKSKIKSKSKI